MNSSAEVSLQRIFARQNHDRKPLGLLSAVAVFSITPRIDYSIEDNCRFVCILAFAALKYIGYYDDASGMGKDALKFAVADSVSACQAAVIRYAIGAENPVRIDYKTSNSWVVKK